MRVLLVHNFYREPGGEDYAFHAEETALRRSGHEVQTFERSSAEATDTTAGVLRTALGTPWATETVAELERSIIDFGPDIVHFHNTFPLISPGAYYTAARAGVPVVQTLHNYRLLCAKADLFRDGQVCEECIGRRFPAPAIRYRCYRGSLPGTGAVAGMLTLHRALGTWSKTVDRYVALTEFARRKFEAGGLPADRLRVKSNFLIDPPPPRQGDGEFVLFVGRLTEEKGIRTLMRAWSRLDLPLHIVGSGPLEEEVRAWAATRQNVLVTGQVPRSEVHVELSRARFLVFPSLWYEGFPIAILEAMAAGVPVLASRRGSLEEIVHEQGGGRTFEAGNDPALAAAAGEIWKDIDCNRSLSLQARRTFDGLYSEEAGARNLVALYDEVHPRAAQVSVAKTVLDAALSEAPPPRTVWIDHTPIADLDLRETVALLGTWLDEERPRRVATANLDFLRLAAANRELAQALRTADLVTPDGTPILWLASLGSERLRERVAGADLVLPLVEEAWRRGRSVFLLGGAPGSAAMAGEAFTARFPGLRIAGIAAPFVELEDEESCRSAVEVVAASRPDLLLVAFGCPKQDLFLARHLDELGCRVGIGVGASLEFVAGRMRRAPRSVQRAGLEWMFRFFQEPRRLGDRYARDLLFLAGALRRARRRGPAHRKHTE